MGRGGFVRRTGWEQAGKRAGCLKRGVLFGVVAIEKAEELARKRLFDGA